VIEYILTPPYCVFTSHEWGNSLKSVLALSSIGHNISIEVKVSFYYTLLPEYLENIGFLI